jgi:hypothetical protein
MEEQAFLDQHVFKGLKKLKDGFKEEEVPFFSASDFAILLERAEYFGISIYSIEPWFEGAIYDVMTHENLKKKATDARWYTNVRVAPSRDDLFSKVESFAEIIGT